MSNVIHLTTGAFDQVAKQDSPVLIDFWAPWCGPCRMQGPILDQVSDTVGEKAIIAKVNVDEEPQLAATFGVQSIPTLVVLKGGPSTVAGPDGVSVSRGGHPGMASAGMGDTLAGVIAALLAQGLPAVQAAECGVRLHARAGELAAEQHGYGLSASDLCAQLGAAWAFLTAQSAQS